jgi:hypothetical protein
VLELGDLNETSTITDVTVNKNGALWNGTTSLIDLGSEIIGTKDVSIMGWFKLYSDGEGNTGRLLENGKFKLFITSSGKLSLGSAGTGSATSGAIPFGKDVFIALTRKSDADGKTDFYIGYKDQAPVLSGGANQTSGLPTVGDTNLTIGNNAGASRTSDGLINKLTVVEGILSLAQITQEWSSTINQVQ